MVPGEGIRQLITPPNGNAAKKNTKKDKTQSKSESLIVVKNRIGQYITPNYTSKWPTCHSSEWITHKFETQAQTRNNVKYDSKARISVMVNSGGTWSRSQGSWRGPLWSQNWLFRWGMDFIRKSFKDFLCWFKFLFLNIFRTLRQMRRSLRITNISSTLSCDLAPGWDQATEMLKAKYSKEKIWEIVFKLLV